VVENNLLKEQLKKLEEKINFL
jgi:predicted nuclease with TOPRIM domain